jgi:hypothetical protein
MQRDRCKRDEAAQGPTVDIFIRVLVEIGITIAIAIGRRHQKL